MMKPRLSVTKILQEIQSKTGLTYRGFERESGVDRRKIKELINPTGKNLTFTIDDFITLNIFLQRHDYSLTVLPFFEPPEFFSSLVRYSTDISIYCTVYYRQPRLTDLSAWDIDGFMSVSKDFVHATGTRVSLEKINALWGASNFSEPLQLKHTLKSGKAEIVISIGSPRMSLMTEAMMRRIVDSKNIDLGFIWADKRPSFASRFLREPKSIPSEELRSAITGSNGEGSALCVNGKYYKCLPALKAGKGEYKSYGIVVIRQINKTILISVSGLNGPATSGSAANLGEIEISKLFTTSGSSPIIWAVFEVDIFAHANAKPIDVREVRSTRLVEQGEW